MTFFPINAYAAQFAAGLAGGRSPRAARRLAAVAGLPTRFSALMPNAV